MRCAKPWECASILSELRRGVNRVESSHASVRMALIFSENNGIVEEKAVDERRMKNHLKECHCESRFFSE